MKFAASFTAFFFSVLIGISAGQQARAAQPPIQALGCGLDYASIPAGSAQFFGRGFNPALQAWGAIKLAEGKEVTAVAFTPNCSGGLVVTRGGGYSGRGLNLNGDDPIYRVLDRLRLEGRVIHGISFDPHQWSTRRRAVFLHDQGWESVGLTSSRDDGFLRAALNDAYDRRGGAAAFSFAPTANGRSAWFAIAKNGRTYQRNLGGERPSIFETVIRSDRGNIVFLSFAPDGGGPQHRWTFGKPDCHQSSGARYVPVAALTCVTLDPIADMWRGFRDELQLQTGAVDFEALLARHEIVGATVVMIDANRAMEARHFGLRNRRRNLPTDGDTLYPAASITKMVAGLAFAIAHESGELPLETTIEQLAAQRPRGLVGKWKKKFLEGRKARRNGWTGWPARIDIGRLLRHEAALGMNGIGSQFANSRCRSVEHLILGRRSGATCNGVKPLKDRSPGVSFKYSGGGYLLAEEAYRQVMGRSLRTDVDRRVLGPAGMHRSFYWTSDTDGRNIARGCPARNFCPGWLKTSDAAAATGLVTHPEEYARLVRIVMMDGIGLERGRPVRVFSTRELRTLFSGVRVQYGLGVEYEGSFRRGGFTGPRVFFHGGADSQGFKTGFYVNRENRKAIVFFLNGPRKWKQNEWGDRGADAMSSEIEDVFAAYAADAR
ncbi:MAG: serine hydrolase domain-containing protein [Pseudomonadota bacterium]